jgi:hypothetical protein
MTASATVWPAAVSERSAALVHGSACHGTVLAAFPTALYLQVGDHADILPVVTRDGLRLPTALAVATSLPTVGWGAHPGDAVVVGSGEVRLPGVTLRAVRTWRPGQAPRATTSRCGAALATLQLPWRSPARAVTELLLAGHRAPSALADRVGTLVGAGPGLTPSGDDVLCGVLLGLRVHPRGSAALVDELWRAVAPRLTTTTMLSAALLREAAEGYAAEPVMRLLERLAGRGSADVTVSEEVTAAAHEALAIGHTSGADLLGGLAGCLDALTSSPALTVPPALTALTALPRSLP